MNKLAEMVTDYDVTEHNIRKFWMKATSVNINKRIDKLIDVMIHPDIEPDVKAKARMEVCVLSEMVLRRG